MLIYIILFFSDSLCQEATNYLFGVNLTMFIGMVIGATLLFLFRSLHPFKDLKHKVLYM